MKAMSPTFNYPFTLFNNSISYGSLQQIGKVIPSRDFGTAKVQMYIDIGRTKSGSVLLRTPVVKLFERNFPVELSFIYDSQAQDLNNHWRFTHKSFKKLPAYIGRNPADTTAVLIEEDGRETTYTMDLSQQGNYWWAPKITEGSPYLSYDETQHLWVWFDFKTNVKEFYDQTGNLLRREDAAGRATLYEYKDPNDANRLTAIVGPSDTRYEIRRTNTSDGYTINFHTSSPTEKEKLLQINYFNKQNQLTRTSVPLNDKDEFYHLDYQYFLEQSVTVTQSDGSKLMFNMNDAHCVKEVHVGDGTELVRFTFSQDPKSHLLKVVFKDTEQSQQLVHLDDKGRIWKVDHPVGYAGDDELNPPDETIYTYDDNGRVKTIAHPGGGQETFEYGLNEGLLTHHEGANGQKTDYYYDMSDKRHLCKCIVRYVNEQAYVTRKVYDYSNGNAFLRFEISPEGRVKEFIPDAWGNVGTVKTYIDDFIDLKGFQPNSAPNLTTVLNWIANLDWVKNKKSQRLTLTQLEYDDHSHSQVLNEFQYGHVDENGKGVEDQLMSRDVTVRDIFGNLLAHAQWQRDSQDPLYTNQEFDGLNRLLKRINPLEETTQIAYQDAQKKVITTQPNGRVEVATYNEKGFIEQHQQSVVIDTQQQTRNENYKIDSMGRPIIIERADGYKEIMIYDHQNRLGFKVTPKGAVTEYIYDRKKRFNKVVQYAKVIDTQPLVNNPDGFLPVALDVEDLLDRNDAANRYSYEFFDESGNLRYTIDAENYVIETQYDKLNRPIAIIKYQDRISDELFSQLKDGKGIKLPFDSTKDRCTRKFYDSDGLVIGEQDARGYVTEYIRNGAGWVTERIVYETKQNPDLNITDFAKVRPQAEPKKDAHTYYFHNNRGLCEVEVDAEGYYTKNDYIACGLLAKSRRYTNKVDANWVQNPIGRPPEPQTSSEDAFAVHDYDLLNRPTQSLNADSKKTRTTYEVIGHVTAAKNIDAMDANVINGDTYRATESQYDGWEQTVAEANPFVAAKLALVDADPNLNPDQKKAEKKLIWDKYSKRHFYDGSGLRIKTILSVADDVQFSKGEVRDVTTYCFYDSERRPIVLITLLENNKVVIQENTYNTFGEIEQTRSYSQQKSALPPALIAKLTGGFITDELRKVLDDIKDENFDVVTKTPRNKRGLIQQKVDPENYVSTYQYNAFRECETEILPVKDNQANLTITHKFDTAGNETETTKQSADVTTTVKREFENPYGKQTQLTDEVGCEYKEDHDRLGRVIKMSTQADNNEIITAQIERDAFNRPIKQTDALQHATQYAYNRAERTTVVAHPVNATVDTIQSNIFGEDIKHIDALGNVQQWQHTVDGKVVQHTDALGHTTIDRFNLVGWQVEKQSPAGTKTTFARNLIGKLLMKVVDADGLKLTTNYQRNLLGQAVEITNARGIHKKNEFNRRGELLKTITDPNADNYSGLNLSRQKQYNAQGYIISLMCGDVEVSDRYFQTFQYDGLSRSTGMITDPVTADRQNALDIQTQNQLNSQGKVIAEIDPLGNVSHIFFNQLGQKRYHVDANGGVIEWLYDAVGNIIMQRHYETAISAADLAKITDKTTIDILALMLKITPQDSVTQYYYDENNCERFSVKLVTYKQTAAAIVSEKNYDHASRQTSLTEYATYINAALLTNITTDKLASLMKTKSDPASDRKTYFILNAKGEKRFIIDPENYITEQRFGKNGQVIASIKYLNAVTDVNTVAQLPPDQVLAHLNLDPAQDRYQYTVYDTVARPIYKVGGEGAVTRFQYDAMGNETEEYCFEQRVDVPQDYDKLVAQLATLKVDPAKDRVTKKEYDAANRVITVTDALGYSQHYKYDALGNVIEFTDKSGAVWKTEFDRAKRSVTETAPAVEMTAVSADSNAHLTATSSNFAVTKHIEYYKTGRTKSITTAANIDAEKRKFDVTYDKCGKLSGTQIAGVKINNPNLPASFSQRPEQLVDITTQIVCNAKGLKVAEQHESGQWTYYIYDNQDRQLYQINALNGVIKTERNAFDQVETEIQYATPAQLDLSKYPSREIPATALEAVLQSSSDDRQTDYEYDRNGNTLAIQKGEIFYYIPGTIDKDTGLRQAATIGRGRPQTSRQYNAFSECIYQGQLLDPKSKKAAEQIRWYDRAGKLAATCDPNHYVKRYFNNTFGEEETRREVAKSLAQAPMTLAALDLAIGKDAQPNDRVVKTEYEQRGLKTKVTRQNASYSTLNTSGNPSLITVNNTPLSQQFSYDQNGKLNCTTYEDGSEAHYFYNLRGDLIGETDVTRHGLDGSVITPLTLYGVNAHGQRVKTLRSFNGAVNPNSTGYVSDVNDQTELMLFDVRGLVTHKQDANQTYYGTSAACFTYNRDRNSLARQWWTSTQLDRPTPHIDETQFVYDALNRKVISQSLRDNAVDPYSISSFKHNIFGDITGEGFTEGKYHLDHRYDNCGNLWFSNDQGINTIYLTDIANRRAVQLQSPSTLPTYDLSNVSYKKGDHSVGLEDVLKWDTTVLERTEMTRDAAAHVIERTAPQDNINVAVGARNMPLNIAVGRNYPEFGEVSLSWPRPRESNIIPALWLWKKGQPKGLPLSCKKIGSRTGIDVSNMVADAYEFAIMYHYGYAILSPVYATTGELQLDTNNLQGSTQLIAVVESENKVRLTGKVTNLNKVEVWQDMQLIKTMDVTTDPNNKTLYVDLSDLISGSYQIKAVNSVDKTWPFTIYTDKLSKFPLAREIHAKTKLAVQDNKQGTFSWQIPTAFAQQEIQIVIEYLATDGSSQKQTFTVKSDKAADKENFYSAEISFTESIKSIQKFSMSLKVDDGDNDWLPFYQNQVVTLSNSNTYDFGARVVMYVTPCLGLKAAPVFKYLDTSLDREQVWKQIYATGITSHGFAFDVTGFQPGKYPYKVEKINGVDDLTSEFAVAAGSMIFVSEDMNHGNNQKILQPLRSYVYDAWGNVASETDTLGHTTEYEYNDQNKTIKKIEPAVEIYTSDGSHTIGRPVTQYGYNKRGFSIGTTDANGHADAFDLNEAGQQRIHYLGDGTATLSQLFDGFGRVIEHWDARGRGAYSWKNMFDHNNNVITTTSPMGKMQLYTYDESNRRKTDTLSWNGDSEATQYIYDVRSNITKRIDQMGYETVMTYRYNNKLEEQTAAGANYLSWTHDDYGNLIKHTDLSGASYYYTYDQKKQLTRKYSEGGYHGEMLKVNPVTVPKTTAINLDKKQITIETHDVFTFGVVATPSQDQRFTYKWGRAVVIRDEAMQQTTTLTYDMEGRRTQVVIKKDDEVTSRVRNTTYDALGREATTWDTLAQFTSGFDAVGNRVLQQAVLYPEGSDIPVSSQTSLNIFDAANRAIKSGNTNLSFTNGFKSLQDGVAFSYNPDGLLETVGATLRQYDLANRRIYYRDENGVGHSTTYNRNGWISSDSQSNGPETTYTYGNPARFGQVTYQETIYNDDAENHDVMNEIHEVGFDSWQKKSIAGYRFNHFSGPDDPSFGDTLNLLYDANGTVNGKQGATTDDEDEHGKLGTIKRPTKYMYNSYNGLVLDSMALIPQPKNFLGLNLHELLPKELRDMDIYHGSREPYFYSVNDVPLGHYSLDEFRKSIKTSGLNPYDYMSLSLMGGLMSGLSGLGGGEVRLVTQDPLKAFRYMFFGDSKGKYIYQGTLNRRYEIDSKFSIRISPLGALLGMSVLGPLGGFRLGGALGQLQVSSAIQSLQQANSAPAPTQYIVKEGDTFEAIAQNMFGDATMGGLLAAYNHWSPTLPLTLGLKLNIPQLSNSRNAADTVEPYQIFVSAMLGSMYPHLDTPQPKEDDGFWDFLVSIVTIALSVVVAGPLGLAASVFGAGAGAVAVGVTAGLVNAALQGVAIATGLEKHFSVANMVAASFAAGGLVSAFGEAGASTAASGMSIEQIGTQILSLTRMAVIEQLAQLLDGKKFDVNAILTSVGISLLDMGIDAKLLKGMDNVAKGIIHDVMNPVLGSVARGNLAIEQIAMQAMGNLAMSGVTQLSAAQMQKEAQNKLRETQDSDPSQQTHQITQRRTANSQQLAIERARMHALMDAEDWAGMDLDKMLDPRINTNDSQLAYAVGSEVGDRTTRLQRWSQNQMQSSNNKWQQIHQESWEDFRSPLSWASEIGKYADVWQPKFVEQTRTYWSEGLQASRAGWSNAVNNGQAFATLGSDEGQFLISDKKFSQASQSQFFVKAMVPLKLLGKGATGYSYYESYENISNAIPENKTRVEFEEAGKHIFGWIAGAAVTPLVAMESLPVITVPLGIATEVAAIAIGGVVGKQIGDKTYDFYEDIHNERESFFIKLIK